VVLSSYDFSLRDFLFPCQKSRAKREATSRSAGKKVKDKLLAHAHISVATRTGQRARGRWVGGGCKVKRGWCKGGVHLQDTFATRLTLTA